MFSVFTEMYDEQRNQMGYIAEISDFWYRRKPMYENRRTNRRVPWMDWWEAVKEAPRPIIDAVATF